MRFSVHLNLYIYLPHVILSYTSGAIIGAMMGAGGWMGRRTRLVELLHEILVGVLE